MKSEVYFVPVKETDKSFDIDEKLERLIAKSGAFDVVGKGHDVAVKLHFGEDGNTGFVDPDHLKVICDGISRRGGTPFLSDTNTLYKGRRTNSGDHLELAHEHGFTEERTGAKTVIPDDTKQGNTAGIDIGCRSVKTAKIARFYIDADILVAVNHFKGHMLTGFGGALKNVGMGCATRAGKLAQHNTSSPVFYEDKCIGCGACVEICPVDAIRLENGKALLDTSMCIGCANCVGVCPAFAMFVDFEAGSQVQKKMVEYAKAVLENKAGKSIFINFAIKINKECDCWGEETPRIAPDVGIFLSTDPVSVDKASFDMVKDVCGRDTFKETHPEQDSGIQLEYAAGLGLGNLEYDIIEVE